LSVQDRAFLADAALAILSQTQFGKIAIQKATDPQVRSYADRNVRDYSRLGKTLWKVAMADQPQLPDRLSGEALRDYQRLIDRPPPRFDRLYVYMMFKWHTVALRRYRQAVKTITEPKLRAWAEQSLPLIQDHLQSIRHTAIAKGIPMNPGEGQRTIPKYRVFVNYFLQVSWRFPFVKPLQKNEKHKIFPDYNDST
jgi:putative membrane protein